MTKRRRDVTRDGHIRFGPVQVHPDPRVKAVVEQSRECETVQAVARLMLVHRSKPARVFLLSNMPTELAVGRFTRWSALPVDEANAYGWGFRRLTEAGVIDPASGSTFYRLRSA